jgi:hypothetical protein
MSDTTSAELADRLRSAASDDHERGCQGRYYSCECGYDKAVHDLLVEAANALRARPPRERLADQNHKDATEFCKGAFGPFVTDVSQYVEIISKLMQHATDHALALRAVPQAGADAVEADWHKDFRQRTKDITSPQAGADGRKALELCRQRAVIGCDEDALALIDAVLASPPSVPGVEREYDTGNKRYPREEDDENNEEGA